MELFIDNTLKVLLVTFKYLKKYNKMILTLIRTLGEIGRGLFKLTQHYQLFVVSVITLLPECFVKR